MVLDAKKFDAEWASLVGALSTSTSKAYPDLKKWTPEGNFKAKLSSFRELIDDKIVSKVQKEGLVPDDLPDDLLAILSFADSVLNTRPQGGPGGNQTSTSEKVQCPTPITNIKTSFADIAGIKSVKDQMMVNYVYPFVFSGLFPQLSKGTLLYGPPGTGKSSIAKAAVREIPDSIFYAPSPATIKGKYLGETEKNIRGLFECADDASKDKKIKVAIIFIDEFEAIGGERSKSEGAAASVNALLQEMDGVVSRDKVSVLAATNYPWCLDSAILRRFTTRIMVGLPDPIAIEFLIRQALAAMYTLPGEGDRGEDGKVKVSAFYLNDQFIKGAEYMQNITDYGGKSQKRMVRGWTGSSEEILSSPVTDASVKKLVADLGPTEKGRKFLSDWATGADINFDDSRLSESSIFGYSPADISKLMKYAINKASMEALHHGYTKESFGGEEYFVADINNTKGPYIRDLPPRDKSRALTFALREHHLEEALTVNKSTVDSIGYFRMLYYERNGYLPQDQIDMTCG
jgi:SpoVK/Ycf46/Vps4 family AAA+-type ATPase